MRSVFSLTLAVVTVSAWRVSVVSIASTVQNLPEPPKPKRRRRWVLPILGVVAGTALAASGISSAQGMPFLLGVSLGILGLATIARGLRLNARAVYTTSGLAIVVLWLLPWGLLDRITTFSWGMDAFVVGGLMIVVGSTWVLMHNVAPSRSARIFGQVRSLAPVLKLSMAYPLRSLFRTVVTLAMFTLVVFTLVVGTVVSVSFMHAWDDTDTFGGGFDVRAVAAPSTPVREPELHVPRAAPSVRVIAAQSVVPLEAAQAVAGARSRRTQLPDSTTPSSSTRPSACRRWQTAIGRRPRSGSALRAAEPGGRRRVRRAAARQLRPGGLPDFKLSGFYVEDGRFAPVPVDVVTRSREGVRLTVIGVLKDVIPEGMVGISTSQQTLSAMLGRQARPTACPGSPSRRRRRRAAARRIESAFLAHRVEAEALAQTLEDSLAAQKTFNWIIEGFMGLGLVVGVAALGVISARSVVERRQQIGVLRSIGSSDG